MIERRGENQYMECSPGEEAQLREAQACAGPGAAGAAAGAAPAPGELPGEDAEAQAPGAGLQDAAQDGPDGPAAQPGGSQAPDGGPEGGPAGGDAAGDSLDGGPGGDSDDGGPEGKPDDGTNCADSEDGPGGGPGGDIEDNSDGDPDDGDIDDDLDLMGRYIFDEETGMVYEVREPRPLMPYFRAGICAALLLIALCAGFANRAGLLPQEWRQAGESILSESGHMQREERQEAIGREEQQEAQEVVEYTPASIMVEGEAVATLASAEAAYALLDEVKAHFDGMAEGEGERTVEFMEEPAVALSPDAQDIQSYDEAFELFTSGRSPVRVMTTLTVTEVKPLPFDTREEEDEELMEGTSIIVSQGREGSETEIARTVYVNGDRSSSRSGSEKQEIEPQDRVIRIGAQEYDEDDSPGRREGREGPDSGELSFIEPIDGDISLNYGQVSGTLHLGLDYGDIEEGAQVTASCGGTVVCAMERGGYGLMIEIDHGNGFVTRYARLGSIGVELGQRVEQGEAIAAPGPEQALHFELRIDGEAFNPRYYLD